MVAFRQEECQTIQESNNIQRWVKSLERLAVERRGQDAMLLS